MLKPHRRPKNSISHKASSVAPNIKVHASVESQVYGAGNYLDLNGINGHSEMLTVNIPTKSRELWTSGSNLHFESTPIKLVRLQI
jgi:hypothetical protein